MPPFANGTLNYTLNLLSLATGRQPVRPLLFSYYITHRCRLNCVYCSDGDGVCFKQDKLNELTTRDAKKLISILSRSSDTLDITGGEPLEREDLEDILAHARSVGMKTILNTKGIGLAERREVFRLTNLLVLSIDSLDEDRLGGILRSRQDVQELLANLPFALLEAGKTGCTVVISAVATPANLGDVGLVMDYAQDNGVGFHLSPEIIGTTVNPALRQNDEYDQLMRKVIKAKVDRPGVLGVPEYLEGIRRFSDFRCYPLLMPTIRPDGMLYYPCLEFKRAEFSIIESGSYEAALESARRAYGPVPDCSGKCQIFCHMGLSMLQSHPGSAMREERRFAG